MISFQYLNKSDFSSFSQTLFDILHTNMSRIAPTGNSKETDFAKWYDAVSDGLRQDARKIVLIYRVDADAEKLVGFFQYYTNEDTFMMEEIQILPSYHGTGVFRALYGYVLARIPQDLTYVTAYAEAQNERSHAILRHLGLECAGEEQQFLRFQAPFSHLLEWYGENEHSKREDI